VGEKFASQQLFSSAGSWVNFKFNGHVCVQLVGGFNELPN